MGLFDFLKKKNSSQNSVQEVKVPKPKFHNKIEKEMYEKNIEGFRDLTDSINYQNALLDRVNTAQQRYKQDGDLEAVIKELEFAFIKCNPPCRSSQCFDLVDYYIKAGQNNKAWSYLNRLSMRKNAPMMHIRFAQARILKKEKKYADAVQMFMLGYLAKSNGQDFRKDKFIKDIKSSANKLEWDDNTITRLVNILEKQIKKKNYDEGALIEEYRKFYEKRSEGNRDE